MRLPLLACATAVGVTLTTALVGPAGAAPEPSPAIALRPAGTYASGVFAESAAQITSYDPTTERLFVDNEVSGTTTLFRIDRLVAR